MAKERKPESAIGRSGAAVAPGPRTTASSARAAGLESGGGPTAERVRQRAHEIYQRRMALGLPGDAEGDWLQAEAEIAPPTQAKP